MPTKNHFAVLGIDIGADENQVKKAYRTLAKKWHPDKNKDAGAKEKFQEIAASYEYLSSTDRREMLERELRRAAAAGPPPPHAPPRSNHQPPPPPPPQKQQNDTGDYRSSFSNQSQNTGHSSTKSASSSTKSSKPRAHRSANSRQKPPHWSESFTKNNRTRQQTGASAANGGKPSGKPDQKSRGQSNFDFTSYPSTPSGDEDDEAIFPELFGDFFYSANGFGGRLEIL
ncbi:DnaJ-like protein subfamily B member 1 [Elysia marginata]|uniref:DnaJ-like protein subfamily B member 1 n=1 Tax=Elysia marginata TaxID=1093978 RepID=A0AAV4IG35_9GAST|nr:DnaJ-like protein subfamily B member 1 [Elysia marginata]